jgi:hypothetical protein
LVQASFVGRTFLSVLFTPANLPFEPFVIAYEKANEGRLTHKLKHLSPRISLPLETPGTIAQHVSNHHHDPCARHRSRLPAAQAPGEAPFRLALVRPSAVFYPKASEQRCTAALLIEVDPVELVRKPGGPSGEGGLLDQYVNDRP